MKNKIIQGDCIDVIKTLETNSVDTIITDPPYGLSFMGKKWDYDVPSIEIWKECLRVLKPGGTALIFAGSRTQHRMAVNVEDAGFILKDCIMWLYGSGFPKATDISKQLDKGHKRKVVGEKKTPDGKKWSERRPNGDITGYKGNKEEKENTQGLETEPATEEAKLWNGWKSHGLKPAYEPILVAMKPNDGTYANNALKWGVSGLNIDGGRIGTEEISTHNAPKGTFAGGEMDRGSDTDSYKSHTGRFPANILLDEEAAKILDEQSGELKSGGATYNIGINNNWLGKNKKKIVSTVKGDKGGASRFFKVITNSKEDICQQKKSLNVNTAETLLLITSPTDEVVKIYSALKAVSPSLDLVSSYLNALSAEKELKSIEINVVQELVQTLIIGIRVATGDQVIVPLFQIDLTQELLLNTLIELKNLVSFVEQKKQKDIIQTIKNLNKLCGYAENTTYSSTQARFKYQPKASKSERNAGCENIERGCFHPTVKPLKLMEYLCRLTATPTGGVCLDPFAGSGTTGVACQNTGRDYILIEREEEYIPIIKARLKI